MIEGTEEGRKVTERKTSCVKLPFLILKWAPQRSTGSQWVKERMKEGETYVGRGQGWDDREHCSNAMHATGTAGKKMPASIRCRLMLHVRTFTVISDKSNTIMKSVYVCTMSVLFIAALLLRVWLAIPVGYGFGSAPGQDPSPRALHH